MAHYQLISFDQPFPAADNFLTWINNKYTLIGILVALLIILAVVACIKSRKDKVDQPQPSSIKKAAWM